jgi:hexokinase
MIFWGDNLDRIEHKLDRVLWKLNQVQQVLERTEREVLVAYEAELAAAEAAAKANSDAEDSAEGLFKQLADIIALLKQGTSDPATAARIQALADSINARAAQLAAAVVANTPAA